MLCSFSKAFRHLGPEEAQDIHGLEVMASDGYYVGKMLVRQWPTHKLLRHQPFRWPLGEATTSVLV